jgi:zinc/manganese transport system substrate-binding protein
LSAAMIARPAALVLVAALLVAGPAAAQDEIRAIASFSILGDLVKNVGGARVEVATLVGPNGNAHVFEPSPADSRRVADATVVVVNGLGFEGWLGRLVKASGTKAAIVVASTGISPRHRTSQPGPGGDETDPHAWQSVANAKIYVANIRDALIKADPMGEGVYQANAMAYLARLDALEHEVRDVVAGIAADRRRVITSHDAFGYFQDAYGVAFTAPQGMSSEAEASAKDVARIITQIRREHISAVFLENVTDARLVKLIAAETGARIGGTLYSDALTDENGAAPSYIDLIRHNVRQLAAALGR